MTSLSKCQITCIQAGVALFQNQSLTEVLSHYECGEVLFKSGVVFVRIRYVNRTLLILKRTPLQGQWNYAQSAQVRIHFSSIK